MIIFIVAITLIALLIEYPGMLLTALIVIGCIYVYTKRPDLLAKLGIHVPIEEKEDGSPAEKKDFETTAAKMERAEAEIDKRMKTGYKDDPEWKEKQERLRKHVAQNEEIAEREMKLEMLKEAEQHALAGEWNKVEAIERKIREMAAKS